MKRKADLWGTGRTAPAPQSSRGGPVAASGAPFLKPEAPDPRAVALASRLRSDLGPEAAAALALRLRGEPAAVVAGALDVLAARPAELEG